MTVDVTLRDFFAGLALIAIYEDYVQELRSNGSNPNMGWIGKPGVTAEGISRECFAIADAMMESRKLVGEQK